MLAIFAPSLLGSTSLVPKSFVSASVETLLHDERKIISLCTLSLLDIIAPRSDPCFALNNFSSDAQAKKMKLQHSALLPNLTTALHAMKSASPPPSPLETNVTACSHDRDSDDGRKAKTS